MRHLVIHQQFFTNSDCYKKATKQVPKGIQVHSTGSNNPYLKRYVQPDDGLLGKNMYNNSHNRPGGNVCANAYIGKLADGTAAVYQTLPWDYRCWLSGSGSKGTGNALGYIGFEICEDNLKNQEYFEAAVMGVSVNLVAYLCTKYNIPLQNVHDHKELALMGYASNHADIQHWLKIYGLTMDDYRAEVEKAIQEGVKVTIQVGNEIIGEDTIKKEVLYTAKVVATNNYPVKLRKEPSTSAEILTYIPLGSEVDVYAEISPTWSNISYNGTEGYIMSEFLKKDTLDDPPADGDTVTISREELVAIKKQLETILETINLWLST